MAAEVASVISAVLAAIAIEAPIGGSTRCCVVGHSICGRQQRVAVAAVTISQTYMALHDISDLSFCKLHEGQHITSKQQTVQTAMAAPIAPAVAEQQQQQAAAAAGRQAAAAPGGCNRSSSSHSSIARTT